MTDIDDEALADAMGQAALESLGKTTTLQEVNQAAVRAVIAGYQQQQRSRGVVEVDLEDINTLLDPLIGGGRLPEDILRRFRALAAPGDGCLHPVIEPDIARAVVAAYQAQMRARGVVEVNRDDLDTVMLCYDDDWATAAYDRIRAQIAAPEDTND